MFYEKLCTKSEINAIITKGDRMYNINSSINIELTQILYRYHAQPVYHEKNRKTDGFIYYVKGGHTFDFGAYSLCAKAENFIYLPYGETYINRLSEKYTEYYQIDFKLYENGKPVRLFDTAKKFSSESANKALPIIKRMYNAYTSGNIPSTLFCISDIIKIIGIVKSEESMNNDDKSGMDKIRNSVSYISEHYSEDTSVHELAAMSNMCVSNLEKLFKKHFGMSPTAYRNKIRINHAKNLIMGGFSISEAAQMTGFSDYFYFSRVFKRFSGCSPGSFDNDSI